MPTKEINTAIALLELELKRYELLLNESIAKDEILAKTKVILHNLNQLSKQLNDLKQFKAGK
jgi:hypothetical protein